MSEMIWRLRLGPGPLVATAIHDGHEMRPELLSRTALNDGARLREEDPFTGEWAAVAPTRIVGTRSRFEVDLNRPREQAVYCRPEDAWGLHVWQDLLPDDELQRSLANYDAFYGALAELYDEMHRQYSKFVVFDLHTYNHRRQGPQGPEADPQANPQVNIGTGTMANRQVFAGVIDRFIHDLSEFDFPGGRLDVRENVKFQGGQHARWTHARYPDSACVLAIEFKKFFMDEWTGVPNRQLVDAIHAALTATVPGVLEELNRTVAA